MICRHLMHLPSAGCGAISEALKRIGRLSPLRGKDVDARDPAGSRVAEAKRVGEGAERLGNVPRDRSTVLNRGDYEAVANVCPHIRGADGVRQVQGGFARHRQEGIQVNQSPDALGYPVGHTGDHHPAITVAYQDDVMQSLPEYHVDHVIDMSLETDTGRGEMNPLAQASQGRPKHAVTASGEEGVDDAPVPPAAHGAVDDHIGAW